MFEDWIVKNLRNVLPGQHTPILGDKVYIMSEFQNRKGYVHCDTHSFHKNCHFKGIQLCIPGADLGGQGGQCSPFKNSLLICYCYYKSMKISFNDV